MKENISHRPLQATRAGAARLLSIFASRQKSLLTLAIIFAASFAVETICAAEPVIGILPKTIIGDVFMKNMSDAILIIAVYLDRLRILQERKLDKLRAR
jgi:hypothetical protein